jgi:predicted transcriptional regulator
MQRSKLEAYEDILSVLVKKPLIIDSLAFETNMDLTVLKQHLDFLIKSCLVEERVRGKKTLYADTERGIGVLKILNFQKYLEKASNLVRVVEEALDTMPSLSSYVEKKKRKSEKENENY